MLPPLTTVVPAVTPVPVTVNPFTFVEGAPVNVTAVLFVVDVPLLVPVSVPALPLTVEPSR